MRTFILNKLVRDGIVPNIRQLGGTADARRLDGAEFEAKLLEKFQEELAELRAADTSEAAGEIGDLYELLDCLAIVKGTTPELSRAAQAKRKSKMGGFEDRQYVETITIPDDDPWVEYYVANPERYHEAKS